MLYVQALSSELIPQASRPEIRLAPGATSHCRSARDEADEIKGPPGRCHPRFSMRRTSRLAALSIEDIPASQVARRGIGALLRRPGMCEAVRREEWMRRVSVYNCTDFSMSVSIPPASTLSFHETEKFRDDHPRKYRSPFSPHIVTDSRRISLVLSIKK